MPTPFVAMEARTAAAVMRHLANAQATLGSSTFPVLFNAAYADPLGMAGTAPRATALSVDAAAATLGTALTINGTAYTVRDKQPDGTGMTVLLLESA
jgi:hypothetical protein